MHGRGLARMILMSMSTREGSYRRSMLGEEQRDRETIGLNIYIFLDTVALYFQSIFFS